MTIANTFAANPLHLELPHAPTLLGASTALDVARNLILEPAGLDENRLDHVLGTVMGSAVDYGDLYFQLSRDESWALEDGIVKAIIMAGTTVNSVSPAH